MLIGVIAEELLGVLVEPVYEPASALDSIDAYLSGAPIGLLSEAATAADVAAAILIYNAAIAEAATAGSAQDGAITVVTGAIDEAATAVSAQDATVVGAVIVRSAMLPEAFVNSDTSREANVAGIMANI